MACVRIQTEPIKREDFISPLAPSEGCECCFVGVVRNRNNDRAVSWVEYSSHNHLAVRMMEKIVDEALETYGRELDVMFVHRTGRLKVGEVSLYISVSSPHRQGAFAASRCLVEELKKRVPIWKKESYEDGQSEWLEGQCIE